MSGTQQDHPAIRMPSGKSIKVEALKGTLPVHADGETICYAGKNLEVKVINRKINLVCE
jgi:diacylglycerol kinase family enzyme